MVESPFDQVTRALIFLHCQRELGFVKNKINKSPLIYLLFVHYLIHLGMGNTHAILYVTKLIFDEPCAGLGLYSL